jgi:FkbM family methyltransferase
MTITLPYGTFHVRPGDSLNDSTAQAGFWDGDLQPFFDRVPEGSLTIDVGAHVGFYSVYLAKVRGCAVIAHEGHPVYLPLLRENVVGLPVRVDPRFAYSRACRLREQLDHETRASNTWLPAALGVSGVPAVTLDAQYLHVLEEAARRLGGVAQSIGLLKVDAQGADLHVLLGAEQIIARWHPPILLEYEAGLAAQHGHTAEDYDRWIAEHGYRKTAINGWNAYLEWA